MHPLVLLLALAVEVPITSPTLGPAALSQYGAAAASDGDAYLAVWTDGRSNRVHARATRLTRDGEVLDPTGIVIPTSERPGVVWTGNSYLLVWGESGQTIGMRLDRDARTIDGPRVLIANAPPASIAVKGTQVAIAYTSPADLRAAFFDANAQPVADVRLAANVQDRYNLQLIATNSGFTATWLTVVVPYVWNGARTTLEAIRFDRNGTIDEPRILIDEQYVDDPTIATDGDAYVVVARDASNLLNARSVSADLSTVGTRHTLPEPILDSLSLLWHGSQYVLIGDAGIALRAQKLNRDATPGDAISFENPPFSGTAWSPIVTTNGSDLLVTWSSTTGENVGTGLDVFGSLVTSSFSLRRRELLSRSAPRQTRPQLTNGGANVLATWTENAGVWAKRLDANGNAIDAQPLRIADAYQVIVTFDGASYIASWYDFIARQIVTKRIPRDGALRIEDVTRIETPGAQSLSSASSGATTLLAWVEHDEVRVLRVGVDATPTTIAQGNIGDVDVAANGTDTFLVAWGTYREGNYHHGGPPPESIRGARITTSLTNLDGNGFDIAATSAAEGDPVVASNGSEWLVLWTHDHAELRARRVAKNGTLIDDEAFVTRNARATHVAWDGERYVLGWLDTTTNRMHTAWLTQPGAPLIGDRVIAAVEIDFAPRVAIAPLRPGTFMAAYSRIDEHPQIGGVARTFVTVLDGPRMKRRAVR